VTGRDALDGAIRAEGLADDWRAKVRAEVDQLVRDVDAGADVVALVDDDALPINDPGEPPAPACVCPTPAGYCADDCDHCTALADDDPCPADVDADLAGSIDAARWPGAPAEAVPVLEALRERAATGFGPGWREEAAASLDAAAAAAQEDFAPHSLEVGSPAGNPPVSGPGWASRHDPASRAFGVVDRLAGKAALRDVDLPWTPVLNQGSEGACVGFGVADAVNVLRTAAGVVPAKYLDDADALALYHQAQKIDDMPGESYSGTSVLAGVQAGQADGYFGGYLWDFGTSAIAQTLLQLHSPVVVGVPWWEHMYDTGPGGLVTGAGAGKLVGGHCLCIVGLRMKGPQGQSGPFFVWRNSWGPDYGDGGNGYVHHRDLATLLHRQGEAAVPTVKAQAAR
jgi:hypothetical protein